MEVKNMAVLEGILFLSGNEGLSFDQIRKVLGIRKSACKDLIELYKEQIFNDQYRGLMVKEYGGYYKLVTKPEHREFYEELVGGTSTARLSNAALETLAIIAYNAPITRSKIEGIRGLSSDSMLRKLVARDLIEEVGREESPGKPILFNVTDNFMDHFGLTSLEELPKIEKATQKHEDGEDIFATRYTEES